MINIDDLIKTLNSYNINSKKYGPSIYHRGKQLGLCLDIKDSMFGYLTRSFIFTNIDALDDFLKKYFWYKSNNKKYDIILKFDKYDTKTPKLNYTYKDINLSFEDMQNIENIKQEEENTLIEENSKIIYLTNIEKLTSYLINFEKKKIEEKELKNNLKTTENDLKFELLQKLTLYYGKTNQLNKKIITLDPINSFDEQLLENNLINIKNKNIDEIKEYLNTLINIIKASELDKKYILNLYSNNIYKYNIEILQKQIAFVSRKIEAEKNFNIKGSKIHNIDAELKSFLKNNNTPNNMEIFINNYTNNIESKYADITNIEDAYHIISGIKINLPILTQNTKKLKIKEALKTSFDYLDDSKKTALILYNSFYKPICNYIIDNNYPEVQEIIANFDFKYYYDSLDEILHNENNSHYLVKYFKNIKFKNINTYIDSIINICKTVENTSFKIDSSIKAFAIKNENKYQALTLNPLYDEQAYLIEIPANSNLLYIPDKIKIDEETNELSTVSTANLYIKGNITDTINSITLNKYHKKQSTENNITITKDLILDKTYTFNIGIIEGETNE